MGPVFKWCTSVAENKQVQTTGPFKMVSHLCLLGLLCLSFLPGSKQASAMRSAAVTINPAEAHGFLLHSRARRNLDPRWYHKSPDFQAYYRYYNSIGHTEGLYEIDRIRMLYQQMRQLEQTHGPKASLYQNALGLTVPVPKCDPSKHKKCQILGVVSPPTGTAPLSRADVVHLCHRRDPLCKPHIVYLPAGAVPVLCDPRLHPTCKPKPANQPTTPPPPPPTKGLQPTAGADKTAALECDPYWDPDCLIDHPPSLVRKASLTSTHDQVEEDEAAQPASPAGQGFFLYDYRRDLFDPYRYSVPAPDPQQLTE